MASQHFYMMTPGERLAVGPGGTLYETTGSYDEEDAIAAKSAADTAAAVAEPDGAKAAKSALSRMKRGLKGWLKLRKKLTDLMSGKRKGKIPASLARKIIDLDPAGEQLLANDLYALLSEIHDPATLPLPHVTPDTPDAAVALAEVALNGAVGQSADKPVAQGIIPILILAGAGVLLLTLTSFISNRAEVQREKLRIECEKAGECSRTSETVLKVLAVGVVGWFAWEKMGLKKKFEGKKRSPARRRRRR